MAAHVDVGSLTGRELAELAEKASTELAARRAAAQRRAAYRLYHAAGRQQWEPIPWHGARIAYGKRAGLQGAVRKCQPCDCTADGGGWQVFSFSAGLMVTCLPASWLAPVLTFRGGVRCPDRCCMSDAVQEAGRS